MSITFTMSAIYLGCSLVYRTCNGHSVTATPIGPLQRQRPGRPTLDRPTSQMSQHARGRRPLDPHQAQIEAEHAQRAHHLKIAANVVVPQPSLQPVANTDQPVPMRDVEAQRKHSYLLGGSDPTSDAPKRRVGDGAFAIVRVERGADGRQSAVKMYDPQGDETALRHLKNELALAGRIRHPNIIGPGAVQRLGGDRVEIRMDYASGGSLADYVKRAKYASRDGGPLGDEEAGALFVGLVDGVGYLHSNELSHGDLKLSNAMLDGPIVRLIDFGTARQAAPTAEPPLPGTLVYTAPEAIDGHPHDGRPADVWALGVMLYNLLSRGEFPFWGRDEASLRLAVQTAPPKVPPGVSDGARDLIEGMLAKEPGRRLTVGQVRTHPWLQACAKRGVHSRDPMVAADYSASMRHLQRAAA